MRQLKMASNSIGDLIRDNLVGGSIDDASPNEWDKAAKSAMDKQVGGSHYKGLKIQPIEYVMANDMNYCEANVVKYITRHHEKGGADDIRKVIHYCELLLEIEYGEKP
jgi:hypothetical protein